MKRSLICCGDSTNIETWSNIPYFVLKAGIKEGILNNGLRLNPKLLILQKILWNTKQIIKTGLPGGFQYTKSFNKNLINQVNLEEDSDQSLLSHFPAIPYYPWSKKWNVAFYIDATTSQIFKDYDNSSRISNKLKEEFISREKHSYQKAYAIICMSDWAANSVINDYGIDYKKVHVVPGGANLEEEELKKVKVNIPCQPTPQKPLRIGFLGKDWERKGGGFLIKLTEELNQQNIPTVIRAIGPDPKTIPSHPSIQALGFINKQKDTLLFASEICSWHFGTLFSSAEAFGISNRECMRLGTPVITHDLGGISSTFPNSFCGKLFKRNPSVKEVSNWIIDHITPYQNYLINRHELSKCWNEFTWESSIKKVSLILN